MRLTLTATALFLTLTVCRAEVILLNSGVSAGGWNSISGTNVLIEPHPVWDTSAGRWISFANTGYGGTPTPNTAGDIPTATFYQDFYLTGDANHGVGNITVWADDSASVFIDGLPLIVRSIEMGNHCTATGIGCAAGHGVNFQFDIHGDPGSLHRFQFDVYQQGGGPFGLMYSGSVEVTPNPEPGTLGALAGVLVAGVAIVRKRNKSRNSVDADPIN